MDEVTPRRNSQTRDEWGPDAAGATSDPSPPKETQEGPGGGPSCVYPEWIRPRASAGISSALCSSAVPLKETTAESSSAVAHPVDRRSDCRQSLALESNGDHRQGERRT